MLRIGVVGSSKGNGHPFSWSAIINGFRSDRLPRIPFPAIQKYLPLAPAIGDALGARVTCVWDDNRHFAKSVAALSRIPVVARSLDELMDQVDCVIHARDDFWNHMGFVEYYARYRKPVFLDKPIATTRKGLAEILSFDPNLNWIFSASAVAWDPNLRAFFGSRPHFVSAVAPKDWQRYSVHLVEPILNFFAYPEKPFHTHRRREGAGTLLVVNWDDGRGAQIQTTGSSFTSFKFVLDGIEHELGDPPRAFSSCLTDFIAFARGKRTPSRSKELNQIVSLIERGV